LIAIPSTLVDNTLLNASITKTKSKKDKGSLCLNSQATRATKEAGGSSINQNKETHHINSMSNPFAPFLPKTISPQKIQQEASIT
jgi:hypothetical protein